MCVIDVIERKKWCIKIKGKIRRELTNKFCQAKLGFRKRNKIRKTFKDGQKESFS